MTTGEAMGMANLYDHFTREQLLDEIVRWKTQAARNAQTCVRYKIALNLSRQFGIESRAFDGGVCAMLADWLDHQPHCGVPWPSSVFAQKWLEAAGYSEVNGKVGMRATLTLAGPEPIAN